MENIVFLMEWLEGGVRQAEIILSDSALGLILKELINRETTGFRVRIQP